MGVHGARRTLEGLWLPREAGKNGAAGGRAGAWHPGTGRGGRGDPDHTRRRAAPGPPAGASPPLRWDRKLPWAPPSQKRVPRGLLGEGLGDWGLPPAHSWARFQVIVPTAESPALRGTARPQGSRVPTSHSDPTAPPPVTTAVVLAVTCGLGWCHSHSGPAGCPGVGWPSNGGRGTQGDPAQPSPGIWGPLVAAEGVPRAPTQGLVGGTAGDPSLLTGSGGSFQQGPRQGGQVTQDRRWQLAPRGAVGRGRAPGPERGQRGDPRRRGTRPRTSWSWPAAPRPQTPCPLP